jgi:hypothetical protein
MDFGKFRGGWKKNLKFRITIIHVLYNSRLIFFIFF